MIENLRKYTGLMIVALVAIFIGLTFFGNQIRNILSPGGAPYMRIGDRTYSVEDYGQLGERSLQVAGMMQMYMLVGQLGGDIQRPDPQLFFTNRMLLRQAQDQFGVHPSEEQILGYLRERSAFADPKTGFNQRPTTPSSPARSAATGCPKRTSTTSSATTSPTRSCRNSSAPDCSPTATTAAVPMPTAPRRSTCR